ncbi:MAG: phospholipase D-like domain-containing protein [Deltaproteobacteria bacterium]|nr:phospholipase D-like domain-containing protein [Deltaproteobacteria bacterium]
MPTIYDNVYQNLLDGLKNALKEATSASICVAYFHLRGWKDIADLIENFSGQGDSSCRILVGMHRPPEEAMREIQGVLPWPGIDGARLSQLKRQITESFKHQLEFGVPSAEAEMTLRRLFKQLRSGKVRVKSYPRHPLHAKLYLIQRKDPIAPLIAFLGSSNLTYPGLTGQGELNVDVVDQDAANKLLLWFEKFWNDQFAIDPTEELAQLIEQSWVLQENVRPYLVYLKMAYYLSQEARQGEREFKLPKIFEKKGTPLLDFQTKAVSLAAHHLYRRGGALLGDVVGLGKTFMAIAIARILQEDDNSNTLIICPPKLKQMWEWYVEQYEILGKVLSLGEVIDTLPYLPRFRLLIIDESHNLRNREGKRYRAIQEYIELNEPRVLLLTATPYNKHFEDLSNQLRLFLDEDQDLKIRPERFFRQWIEQGKTEWDFRAQYQALPTSLRAFEKSTYPEDWRDLMRLFLVRRTRHFIMRHYARFDDLKKRYYVMLNSVPFYFPVRKPRTLTFFTDENNPEDQYSKLFSERVVQVIETLNLPRYGLARYLIDGAEQKANTEEKRVIANLTRAGRRLIGFCRTNLFKRLESSGYSFILSLKRHILRNLVVLYALENGRDIPIGLQNVAFMDTAVSDEDAEVLDEELENLKPELETTPLSSSSLSLLNKEAEKVYELYSSSPYRLRFQWLGSRFFTTTLKDHLREDIEALIAILYEVGEWRPESDEKLKKLYDLITFSHPEEKLLVFTQFADTARYLGEELKKRNIQDFEIVTSGSANPVGVARRFSPQTNGGLRPGETELRILIATDVLAEGQNLQDCHIVVNYDLPWAIIRLIQRAGRVDRIGQRHDTILVYSFLPAEGVERVIRLRRRLFERLKMNQEVIGTDESFFGEEAAARLRDLYTEKAGVLDDDESDEDIDLSSLALQVWTSALEADRKAALSLPQLVSTTAPVEGERFPGMIAYLSFPDGTDALVQVDENGELISQSLSAIFQAAACAPDTLSLPRAENHYDLIRRCVELALQERQMLGGQLGSLRSISRKIYERLNAFRQRLTSTTSIDSALLTQLDQAIDLIFRYPLKESAREALGRQIRLGITDDELAQMVIQRAREERLCEIKEKEPIPEEPQIICALGLRRMET